MLDHLVALWRREPLRVVLILAVAVGLAAIQLTNGVGWQEVLSAIAAWLATELARSQVTPVQDPRLDG